MERERAEQLATNVARAYQRVQADLAKTVENAVRAAQTDSEIMGTLLAIEAVFRAASATTRAQIEAGLIPGELFYKLLGALDTEDNDGSSSH